MSALLQYKLLILIIKHDKAKDCWVIIEDAKDKDKGIVIRNIAIIIIIIIAN